MFYKSDPIFLHDNQMYSKHLSSIDPLNLMQKRQASSAIQAEGDPLWLDFYVTLPFSDRCSSDICLCLLTCDHIVIYSGHNLTYKFLPFVGSLCRIIMLVKQMTNRTWIED